MMSCHLTLQKCLNWNVYNNVYLLFCQFYQLLVGYCFRLGLCIRDTQYIYIGKYWLSAHIIFK